jgi:hypothetical protein
MEQPVQVPEISSTTPPFQTQPSNPGRQEIRNQPVQVNVVSSRTSIQSREVFAALERLIRTSDEDSDE